MKLRFAKKTRGRRPLTEWKPLDELDPEPVTPGQCTATTSRGKQCALPAVPGSTRCRLEAHQRM